MTTLADPKSASITVTSPNTELSQPEITYQATRATAVLHHFPTLVPLRLGHEAPSRSTDGQSGSNMAVHVLYGELAEHAYLGDGVTLQDVQDNTKRMIANQLALTLPNGLKLTYGQINWLAGDFYGTNTPISDGTTPEACVENFMKAFQTLAIRPEAKTEAEKIISDGQAEIDAVNAALKDHKDPSASAYLGGSISDNGKWVLDTWNRPNGEGFLGLAMKNFDHFGEDARKAYTAGHAAALDIAKKGDLNMAYAMNAFADHFLEDSFSAGHMRTPRRFLHRGGDIDLGNVCAKYMHDEDSAIGLSVANPARENWTAFGDKRILDKEDRENKIRCKRAIQTSVDEVTQAFNLGRLPDVINGAWVHAPTLESARDMSKQELSPLFTPDGQVRNNTKDRTDKGHHPPVKHFWGLSIPIPLDIWFADIAGECELSGLWGTGKIHM